MEKYSVALFLTLTLVVCNFTSASESSYCAYGITVKDLLKLAGIHGADLLSYVAKLKAHNIDETVLASLTFQQLNDIGITALGDRLKIYNFFSKDINDCTRSSCQNNGICRDGFRCFSCICDPSKGYYGPSCQHKCPCLNGGVCKTEPTGFKCVCPLGYSGNLCETKYFTEEKWIDFEDKLKQLTARLEESERQLQNQTKQIKDLETRPAASWQLLRTNEVLNQLDKIQLHHQTPTYTQKLPIILPKNTRAILISVYCNFGNVNGHAYLDYVTYQQGNDNVAAKAEGYNTHYHVHANTFLYEQMIPWNSSISNELIFMVTRSVNGGGDYNWYRVRLVGYITSP